VFLHSSTILFIQEYIFVKISPPPIFSKIILPVFKNAFIIESGEINIKIKVISLKKVGITCQFYENNVNTLILCFNLEMTNTQSRLDKVCTAESFSNQLIN